MKFICLRGTLLLAICCAGGFAAAAQTTGTQSASSPKPSIAEGKTTMTRKVVKTDEEWKRLLTPDQYLVLRHRKTERAFTGEYDRHKEAGIYRCAGCGNALFESSTKFESGCGWPAFFNFLPGAVETELDTSEGMIRDEVHCAACGGHLGHVFADGPPPTGLRYCINSLSLKFEPKRPSP